MEPLPPAGATIIDGYHAPLITRAWKTWPGKVCEYTTPHFYNVCSEFIYYSILLDVFADVRSTNAVNGADSS